MLSLLAAAGLLPGFASAEEWNKAAFAAKSVDDVIKLLGGSAPQQSDQVILNGPEIAESVGILAELKARGTRLYALTNWSYETFPVARRRFDCLRR